MPVSRKRDGNYNVCEKQSQMNKNGSKHIVTPKTTPSSPDAIESQVGHDDTDRNTLLPTEVTEKNPFPRPWKTAVVGLMVLFLCAAAAILGYSLGNHGNMKNDEDMTEALANCIKEDSMKKALSYPDVLSDLHDTYINKIDSQPTHWLIDHYKHQVYSGSHQDKHLVADIVSFLSGLGVFDEVRVENYTALVSVPQSEGSLIQVVNRSSEQVLYRERVRGDVLDHGHGAQSAYIGGSIDKKLNVTQTYIPPFVAYSKAGTVQGELVNINYGSESDFMLLVGAGVLLADKIALMKSGGGQATVEPLVNVMQRVEQYNLSGILVYTETAEYSTDVAYDNLNTAGDPQTPGYPSIDGVWRQPVDDLTFPTLAVQTISCDTAHRLLGRLSGQMAPPSWQGKYNGTLYMGRKSNKADSWFVQLDTTNHYQETTIQNVIATIRGFISPRQVVMLGASRNSFESSQQRELVSTDALLRFAHPLVDMLRGSKWLPKRSISFCFWGGAEFGDIGRTEHMEGELRQDNIVTYIDLDLPKKPLLSLMSIITPGALQDLVTTIVHKRIVSLKDEESYDYDPRAYDDEDSILSSGFDVFNPLVEVYKNIKYMDPDDLPQIHWTRIPLVQVAFGAKSVPAFGSPQEHEVTKLLGAIALSLADQIILAYNNPATASAIKYNTRQLLSQAYNLQPNMKDTLEKQASRLYDDTAIFDHMIDNQMDPSDPDHVNAINMVLLELNKQLVDIQNKIYMLSSSLPDRQRPTSDDLELDDQPGPEANIPNYSAATMRQFSELLISMHNADKLMKTVHFQVISYNTNSTDSIGVSDEDYDDLERGWI